MKDKVFTWEEMWQFIDILIKHRNEDISVLFTEKENGELINLPRAKKFIDTIKRIENEAV